jgi:transcriptional regulator with XRE-family HTH domain
MSTDDKPPRVGTLPGHTIGERINAALLRAGVSQAELARRIGKSAPNVNRWARGSKEPEPGSLVLIAGALGVTVDELLGVAEGQEPPFAAWREFLATPEGASITAAESRALRTIAWQPGHEPTVAGYLMMLAGLRGGTRPRQ